MLKNDQVFRGLIDDAVSSVFDVAESAHGARVAEFGASLVRNAVRRVNPDADLLLDGKALPLAQNTAIFDAGERCQQLCCVSGALSFSKVSAKISERESRGAPSLALDMVNFCVRIDRAVDDYKVALDKIVDSAVRAEAATQSGMQTRKRKERAEGPMTETLISTAHGSGRIYARATFFRDLADILGSEESDDSEFTQTLKLLRDAIDACKAALTSVRRYTLAFDVVQIECPEICGSVEGPFAGGEIFRLRDTRIHKHVRTGVMLFPQVPGTRVGVQLQRAVFSANSALTAPWHRLAKSAFKLCALREPNTLAISALSRRTALLALGDLLAGQLDIAIYRNAAALDLFTTRTVGGDSAFGGFVEHARRWYVDPARLAFYATVDGNRAAVVDVDWCDGQFLVRDGMLAAANGRSQHDRAVMAIVANVAYVALWAVGVKRAREIAVEAPDTGALEVAEALCGQHHMPRGMFAFADVPLPPAMLSVCAEMLASDVADRETLSRWRRRLLDAFATLADCIESTYSVRPSDYGTAAGSDHAFVQSNSNVIEKRDQWQQVCSMAKLTAVRLGGEIRSPTFSGAFSRKQVLFVAPRLRQLHDLGGISSRGLADALKKASGSILTAFAQMVRREGLTPDVLGDVRCIRAASGEEERVPLCVDCTFYGEPSLGEGVTRTIAESVIREYAAHDCAAICVSSTSNIVELKSIPGNVTMPCKQCREMVGVDKDMSRSLLRTSVIVALSFYIQMSADKFGSFMIGPLLAAALSRATFSARTLAPLFYACHPTKLLSDFARVYLSDESDSDGAPCAVGDQFEQTYRPAFEAIRRDAPKFTREASKVAFTLDLVGGLMYRMNGVCPSDLVCAASFDSLDALPLDDLRTLMLVIFDFPPGHWRLENNFTRIAALTKKLLVGVTGAIGASIDVSEYVSESTSTVDGIAVSRITFSSKFDRFISTRLSIQRQQARDAGRSSIEHDPAIREFKQALDETVSRLEVERARLYTTNFVLTESREVLMQLYETITGETLIHGRALVELARKCDLLPDLSKLRAIVDHLMQEEARGGHILRREEFEATAWTYTLMRCSALGNQLAELHDFLDIYSSTIFVRMSSLGTSDEDVPYLDTVSTCDRSWRQAAWPTYAVYRERMDLLLAQRLHFTSDELENTVYDT